MCGDLRARGATQLQPHHPPHSVSFRMTFEQLLFTTGLIFEGTGAVKVTTLLDLAGLVIVLAAVAITAGLYFIPAGLAVFGLGLLGISWLLDARKGTRK